MERMASKLLYALEKGRDSVLVTVIRDAGSTPRGTGAQMLVDETGPQVGSVGGGNVENLAIRHAQTLIGRRCGGVCTFALRPKNGPAADGGTDTGMVCGGDLTALFTFIPGGSRAWQDLAADLLRRIRTYQGGYWILPLSGQGGELAQEAPPEDQEVFALPISTGERAILFGAGHCAQALTPVLRSVGFRISVFDDRQELLTKERFPQAEALICGDFAAVAQSLALRPEDYIVVMTNGHTHDFEVQEQVLRHPAAYVGVIGSRSKTASVNRRLREAGVEEAAIAQVHTPVGLPIHAVTPEEIAVSIAGEMIAHRAQRRQSAGIPAGRSSPMH